MMSKQKSISKSTAIRRAIRMFLVGEDGIAGAALVEFTIFAPLLVIASIYTMDFGFLFYNKMEMQNAAQAGAQWAIANRTYSWCPVQQAAQNATYISAVTVTAMQFCGCSVDSSGTNPVVTPLPPPPTPCTSSTCTTCAGSTVAASSAACTSAPNTICNTNGVQGNYVTVTATPTTTYQAFVPYGLFSSSTPSISATTTARMQ